MGLWGPKGRIVLKDTGAEVMALSIYNLEICSGDRQC